ncbi:uncharacterized protein LOC133300217 [Gastrolobium bilobum]|uniref:uncharacterized protein LOC133300217 n=1 Tax=Gastrolobium bilobum TaxID=150636 RepID=UPI002AAFA4BC|nr:uncharacterized protein LOC133300217 [Gastrolobium bilobum]
MLWKAHDDSSERRLRLGPRDNFVLFMQSRHSSEVACMEEPDYKSLTIRSGRLAELDVIPEPIVPSFRFSWRCSNRSCGGKVTVTLEDVAMIIGLPTDGEPGMSKTQDLICLVPQLLGRTPSASDLKGGTLETSWLDRYFANVEDWM